MLSIFLHFAWYIKQKYIETLQAKIVWYGNKSKFWMLAAWEDKTTILKAQSYTNLRMKLNRVYPGIRTATDTKKPVCVPGKLRLEVS